MKILSEEFKDIIINDYQATDLSIIEVCNKHKIKISDFFTIKFERKFKYKETQIPRKDKIKKVEKKKVVKNKQKLENEQIFNAQFFKNIDSEQTVYWAGFIMGGEYINPIKIRTSLTDISHLEMFKHLIGFNYKTETCKRSCYIKINHPKTIADLSKYDFKSIPQELLHHFIRGIYDACGNISLSEDSVNFWVSIPNGDLCEEFQKILIENCGLNKTKISFNKVAYTGSVQVERIMRYLYKNATVYLQRKYDLCCSRFGYDITEERVEGLEMNDGANDTL